MNKHFLEPLLESSTAGYELLDERTGEVVAGEIELAVDSASRKRGLLGRSGLAAGSVLIIAPCNAIHTFFMRFAIDLVFVDRQGVVLKTYRGVRPWRIRLALGAFATLEMAKGAVDRTKVLRGDRLFLGPKRRFEA
jgi:uncharacterized protein